MGLGGTLSWKPYPWSFPDSRTPGVQGSPQLPTEPLTHLTWVGFQMSQDLCSPGAWSFSKAGHKSWVGAGRSGGEEILRAGAQVSCLVSLGLGWGGQQRVRVGVKDQTPRAQDSPRPSPANPLTICKPHWQPANPPDSPPRLPGLQPGCKRGLGRRGRAEGGTMNPSAPRAGGWGLPAPPPRSSPDQAMR